MMNLMKATIIGMSFISNIFNGTLATKETNYTIQAIVTGRDELVDQRGEAWEYEYIPFSEGTQVIVTFDNNRTEDLIDDIIIKIEK